MLISTANEVHKEWENIKIAIEIRENEVLGRQNKHQKRLRILIDGHKRPYYRKISLVESVFGKGQWRLNKYIIKLKNHGRAIGEFIR